MIATDRWGGTRPKALGRARPWVTVILLTVVLLVLPAASGIGPSPGYASRPHPQVALEGRASAHPPTKFVQHVVLILMENHGLYQLTHGGAYQRYLATKYGSATQFYAVCHPSVPNYLAMTSGRTHQCGTNHYAMYNGTHIGDLLDRKHHTWGSYLESMPRACSKTGTHMFNTHTDPFIAYHDVVTNASRCATHVQNSRVFNSSVLQGTLRKFSLYVPNMKDNCHSSTIRTCDTWLKRFLGPILNSTRPAEDAMVDHTVFFILYDESLLNDSSGYAGAVGGHVFFAAVSPWTSGLTLTRHATLYDLLSTVEWLLGLGSCGGHDGTAAYPAMKGLFRFR